ncbi:MAG: serine hydrolase domain-containing protein [Candidatus Hermodarchaeota archaeon]
MYRKIEIYFFIFVIISLIISPINVSLASNNSDDSSCLSYFDPKIDAIVAEKMEQGYIPSLSLALIQNNSILWSKGYGEQPEIDSIFMSGSVTKSFTVVALLQLYEQGVFDLDDDIDNYLPYSLRNPFYPNVSITFRMLMRHESSIQSQIDYELAMYQDVMQKFGMEYEPWLPFPKWIQEYLLPNGSLYDPRVWGVWKPGTSVRYSNIGYDVLIYLLEILSNQSFVEYFREHIFNPLNMQDTGFNISEVDQAKLAQPYAYMFPMDPNSTGNVGYPIYNHLGYGSGAVRSNVLDLSRYMLIHMHKGVSNGTRILKDETIEMMHQISIGWESVPAPFWDGIDGGVFGYRVKFRTNMGRGTDIPYGVVALANQEFCEEELLNITKILQNIVYDIKTCSADQIFGFLFIEILLGIVVSIVVVYGMRNSVKRVKGVGD